MATVLRIKPLYYVHILDQNTNVTRVVSGPATITTREHERAIIDVTEMMIIPPRCYAIIKNPIQMHEKDGGAKVDANGNYILRHGDVEMRFHTAPFPLYPGEEVVGAVSPLMVIAEGDALRLRCTRPFGTRRPGDEWLYRQAGTYVPQVEVEVVELVKPRLIGPDEALRLQATREFVDENGVKRAAGEEWLERRTGMYLPGVHETVKQTVRAIVLTPQKALHLRAVQTYVDVFGVTRKAGSEWLVRSENADCYLPDVFEQVVQPVVPIVILDSRQYCVIENPVGGADNTPQRGEMKLVRGPANFFLQPGETMSQGVQSVPILAEDEALLLRAVQAFDDGSEKRQPGDRWMVRGPREYVCPLQATLVERRRLIPLALNEGIYVRDVDTGRVRSHVGSSYMLTANEELWAKALPDAVEALVQTYAGVSTPRNPTRVVTLRVPNNTAVQIYDYKQKVARVALGPDLVQLGPDEHFTLLSLSGDTPKRPHVVKDLCLQLGPEFTSDMLTVETSDHARLQLRLSYNWRLETEADLSKLFTVPDFIGDFCKAVASRIRSAVAQVSFDEFHRSSARLIRSAVFGMDAEQKVLQSIRFPANGLVVTNVDIQSVEPVDQRTRDSLQKSVQQAIEITTSSQEAAARHTAAREEQLARGRLERQRITDEADSERARGQLVQHQTTCAMLETTGQAQADAYGRAEAAKIFGKSSVKIATLKAELLKINTDLELELAAQREEVELKHVCDLDLLEVRRKSTLGEIEAKKFAAIVEAIGANTLAAISRSGPEMQARILEGLGIQSVLITDGASPINLFDTAKGMIQPKDVATLTQKS